MTGKDGPAAPAGALKALAAGILAFCFVLDPSFGSLTCLNLQKAIVRKEVDRRIVAGIEDGDIVLLKFTKDESSALLQWENAREFEYDGRMYDIVETWAVGDAVYYRCWWDREETELNDRMRVLAARAMDDAPRIGDPGDSGNTSPRSTFFLLAGRWLFPTPASSGMRTRAFSDSYASLHIPPLGPPPWTA